MEKKLIGGREMYLRVTTEEIILLFRENPHIELETCGGLTRWLRYEQRRQRIGITDNIHYDWFSEEEFMNYYGSWYWFFFIM